MSSIALHNIAKEQAQIRKLLEFAAQQERGDPYSGKREDTRFAASIRLDVLVDLPDEAETLHASLHNVSPSGLAMWTRQPIESRPAIFLRRFDADGIADWFGADICHCTPGIEGYLIGVRFHHPLPADWKPTTQPEASEPEDGEAEEPQRHWLKRLLHAT